MVGAKWDAGRASSKTIHVILLVQNSTNRNCYWLEGTRAVAMLEKIFAPSAEPSKASLERSGWGIMPSTFRPSLQIPAIFSSDPLGLASGVIRPSGAQ